MEKLVFDFYVMLRNFDEEVQLMDSQDYNLDEIVSNWMLGYSTADLERHFETMFHSNSESSGADDGRVLLKAVKNLYRRMDRLLSDVNRRKVNRIFINLREETLIVEVDK